MKVEDVPEEWVEDAHDAAMNVMDMDVSLRTLIRAALAAVIPAIQAEALERAIQQTREALETYGRWNDAITPEKLMAHIEPAIRALKKGT